MNKTLSKTLYFLLTLLIILPLLVSCISSKQRQSDNKQEITQSPDKLLSIEEDIETIIAILNGPTIPSIQKAVEFTKQNKPSEQQKKSEEQNQQGGQQQNQQQGQQGNQQTQKQEQQTPTQEQKSPWIEINKSLNDIHKKWNDYAPTTIKMGASPQLRDDFSGAINSLTKQTLTKDINKTILAANSAYYYIDDFLTLYKTAIPNGIKKMIYYSRNSILNGNLGNWDESSSNINRLKNTWSNIQAIINKDKYELINRIDLSITELDNVVIDKSQALTDIKGRIVILNLNELEESYKQKQE